MAENLGTSDNPEDWLTKEAHGDAHLYGLLHAKEIIGEQLANRERELYGARSAFEALNYEIARRREELNLPPEPAIEPPEE